jgi:Ca2+-binding RTX toxin-like protein
VTVTFVDNAGTAEARTSAITTVVGDLFVGGAAADTQTGTAGQDVYHGGGANDNLSTGAEDDIVSGDAGDDTISTGAGDDTITFSGASEGFDSVTGGANVDAILALTDGTTIGLRAISTVEDISANGHSGVKILGSTLNDVLNFTNVTLTGIVEIDGGGGNDALTGSAAADVIIGRAGTDTLNGGIGNDIIEGGAGNDTMNGGANNDVFRFFAGFGNDTIAAGFDANAGGGQDLIDLRGLGITAATFAANVSNTAGNNTLITIAGQGTIRLTGINGANIDVTDFILAP